MIDLSVFRKIFEVKGLSEEELRGLSGWLLTRVEREGGFLLL